MFRVICSYETSPMIRAYKRGRHWVRPHFRRRYWRVVACAAVTSASSAVLRPVVVLRPSMLSSKRLLVLSSHRYRQPNSMCSPRRILTEWQLTATMRDRATGCEQGPQVRPWA